ncbi:glycosyltransferase family 10 [Bacteroidales bacterium OttesenSCG-928-M11]|nr:glycosyltransferase family 10 [Bacteroidales bacterium OttesenSCG-928-M11]
MKTLRIFFVDFWNDFSIEDNFILNLLKEKYQIIIDSSKPDFLFYSSFGVTHFKYKSAIKIYFTGENDVPDFNLCDYGIGSAHISFENRYFRLPLYRLYKGYEDLFQKKNFSKQVLERKFCNFVYSNAQVSDPIRRSFFERLSQYKQVDSGGRYLNNIGYCVDDKIQFIADYKFTIAFENSRLSGYTTEKLLDPMRVNSLPIYWGNPRVREDFNIDSFIYVDSDADFDKIIAEIIRLDTDDSAYLEKLNHSWVNESSSLQWKADFQNFLFEIVEQSPSSAMRTSPYGFQSRYQKKQQLSARLLNNIFFRRMIK